MLSGGHIEVITRREHEWISVTIRDTGTGIPPDILPRIFDPFFTTKGSKGTGFGLSQVYGVVRQPGGTVRLHSKEGQGSQVEMWLPTTR